MIQLIAEKDISKKAKKGETFEVKRETDAHILVAMGVARLAPGQAPPKDRRIYRTTALAPEAPSQPSTETAETSKRRRYSRRDLQAESTVTAGPETPAGAGDLPAGPTNE